MKRADKFLLQKVGGENLLVPLGEQVLRLDSLVVLNPTGQYIWELLAENQSLENLAFAVSEKFDVSEARASADVQVFLDELKRMRLLED